MRNILMSLYVQSMVAAGNAKLLYQVHAIGVVVEGFVYTYFLGYLKLASIISWHLLL
jgi:hypothetical protein